MFSFRVFQRCVPGIGLALCTCAIAIAAPALTTVQDVLYKADGTPYAGTVTISWHSFEAVDYRPVAAQTITLRIVDGFIRVQLVPTTNAVTAASYTVIYNSGGSAQFTENWIVPPSDVPVRIHDVRVGPAGTVIGGTPPAQLNLIQLTDVIGLSAALSVRPTVGPGYTSSRAAVVNSSGSIDGASGVLTDCLHVDGASAPCGTGGGSGGSGVNALFVDGEVPVGTINGANASFNLANTPIPLSSLALFRNGLRLKPGLDYNLNNATITFLSPNVPLAGDTLQASYRLNVTISGVGFVDGEIPAGAVDGSNVTFALAQTPSPATSLQVHRNGLRLRLNLDYAISGTSLVFAAGLAPQPGDVLLCSYRVVQ